MVTQQFAPEKTSQNDSGELLAEQLMDYRSLKKKEKKTHWFQTFIVLPPLYELYFGLGWMHTI